MSEIAGHMTCMSGLALIHNTTYYSFLSVTNGAMTPLTTTVGSNGGWEEGHYIIICTQIPYILMAGRYKLL